MKNSTKSMLGYIGASVLVVGGTVLAWLSGMIEGEDYGRSIGHSIGHIEGFVEGYNSGKDTLERAVCQYDSSAKELFEGFHESAHEIVGEDA